MDYITLMEGKTDKRSFHGYDLYIALHNRCISVLLRSNDGGNFQSHVHYASQASCAYYRNIFKNAIISLLINHSSLCCIYIQSYLKSCLFGEKHQDKSYRQVQITSEEISTNIILALENKQTLHIAKKTARCNASLYS